MRFPDSNGESHPTKLVRAKVQHEPVAQLGYSALMHEPIFALVHKQRTCSSAWLEHCSYMSVIR